MKTVIKSLSILTLFVFTFSSCTKDRSCYCEITTYPNNAAQYSSNSNTEYFDVTKKWMKNSANCVNSKVYTETSVTVNNCRIE